MNKQYYVYFLTNHSNKVIYIGVTNDLKRRVFEHKNKLVEGFTKRYNLVKLIYYEIFDDIENAILREKQLKGGSRQKKLDLINSFNCSWSELYDQI
jgi:putative endonuclease